MKWTLMRCLLTTALLGVGTSTEAANMCPRQDAAETEAIKASAKHFSGVADDWMRLSGGVQVEQGNNRIHAKRIDYNIKAKRLKASGEVLYTNCADNQPFWFLAADQLTLDNHRGAGLVKNAWLVVNDTPFFYLPRYRLLAEQERKSGLLSPRLAISSNAGMEIGLPYYFNLAPNHDATFEPRILSKRGLQLASRYRYLSRFHEGTLKGDWLNDNDASDTNRYSYSIDHLSRVSDRFRAQLQLRRVSDENYIEDLGQSFELTGRNYLASRMLADYVWSGWRLNVTSESLQRVDDSTQQQDSLYEKKPSISLTKNWYAPVLGLELSLRNEWVKFDNVHPTKNSELYLDGERFDSEIILRQTYRRPGFHFTPSAAIRYTDYNVDGAADKDRTLPWFSLDTGLIFEKRLSANKYHRTLEPRLFYLNVAHREQNDLPVFDTGISEFKFSRLFEENRYNGADRIGDADQLTVALISRVIHSQSGQEVMKFGVGHTSYFRNRKVSLPDEDISTNRYGYSDLASEFSINLDEKVKFTSALVWDTEKEQLRRYSMGVRLKASSDKIIDLSHRYLRGDEGFSQGRIGFSMPIGASWSWFGGWRYDLRAGEDIGTMAGFLYESCCWSLGIAAERLLQNIDGDEPSLADGSLDYNTRIGIQFNLRGLGGTGERRRFLERWMENYHK